MTITSPQNRSVRALRLLASRGGRRTPAERLSPILGIEPAAGDQWLLIEGPHLLGDALDAGLRVPVVLCTEGFAAGDHPVLSRLGGGFAIAGDALLDEIADADSPRGLVAAALVPERPMPRNWTDLLFLDRVADPGNLGALLRVAEGAGVDAVALSAGCAGWRHPRALRASAGAALRLPVVEDAGIDTIDASVDDRPSWHGLAAQGEDLFAGYAETDHPTPRPVPRVLAAGSEAHGLTPAVRRRCDHLVSIPMAGALESLNVATAVAVALYEWRRRRLARAREADSP